VFQKADNINTIIKNIMELTMKT